MLNDAIYEALKQELEEAKRSHREAQESFWKLSGRSGEWLRRDTAGVPHPDGSQMIHNAAAEEIRTGKLHLEALIRLNEYLLQGVVPEHLKKKPQESDPED